MKPESLASSLNAISMRLSINVYKHPDNFGEIFQA